MKYSKNTVYVLGTAKLSKTDPILSTHDIFFIGLIIDSKTNIIVDSTSNTVKEKTSEFINSIVAGYDIVENIEELELEVKERYHGMVQKAIIAAVKDARNKYLIIVNKNNKN